MADLLLDGISGLWAVEPAAARDAGVRGVLTYTGSGRASQVWCEDMIAHGVGVGFIQERTSEWAQGGARNARADIDYAASRIFCTPADCRVWFAVSDGSWRSPGSRDGDSWDQARAGIVAYGAELGASWPGRIGFYGNVECLDAGLEGVGAVNPAADVRTWIPCFWNPRSTDLLWQYGDQPGVGIAPPFPDTDADFVVGGVLADVGLWGISPSSSPRPDFVPEEETMYALISDPGNQLAILGESTVDVYAPDTYDIGNLRDRMAVMTAGPDVWNYVVNDHKATLAAVRATPSGDGASPAPVDTTTIVEAVVAELARRLG